jgi:hypothetical protein
MMGEVEILGDNITSVMNVGTRCSISGFNTDETIAMARQRGNDVKDVFTNPQDDIHGV